GWNLMQSGISAGAGLLGVLIGGLVTAHSQRADRRNARIREQLEGFYSPLIGIRDEIRAKSVVRMNVHSATGSAWIKKVELNDRNPSGDGKDKFDKVYEYSNEQMEKDLVPLYQKMLELYLKNKWLAEPSTLKFNYEFVEFVELWKRYFADSLPREVLGEMEHSEKKLYPLYKDLQDTFDRLTNELRN
ncbi:MAG: hypothetical protein ABSD44_17080, partial [Terracidiphilus sp.]